VVVVGDESGAVAISDGVGREAGDGDVVGVVTVVDGDGPWTMSATAKPPVARRPAVARPARTVVGPDLVNERLRCRTAGPARPRSTRASILAWSGW
jgi:hypothetical protein